ncbi:Hypothetical predicted protein [Olea europaea subsp. europaea]|uniref:DUF1985 domain-containing protein n=1 Tax=Olea europaea subsp. europaea TaxID=158383 RepID=A0A8S0QCE1_OLEEU|nr:Hypothetical predicted protein [Olea europaea subsp. europaea]
MDNLDDRLRADFRNSCLRSHELWFKVQGHLTRFGLQEYAIVTGLHVGLFSKGDRYTKALEKRRLKEKYFKSLEKISCAQRLLKGFRKTWARKMSDAKTKNEKNISYTIHEFSIAMQIWAYEAMPELDERFGERVGERSPRLLCWTSTKQPQQCTSVVGPQFHEVAPTSRGHEGSTAGHGHDDKSGAGAEDDETSMSDDRQTPEGNGDDGSKADDSGDSKCDTSSEIGVGDTDDDEDTSGRQSGASPTPMVAPSTSRVQGKRGGPTVMRDNVEGILLDQRILFEMRLRTVKLEIIQHVIEEFARLRDFISTLVPSSGGTSTSVAALVMNEPNIWDDPHEDGEDSDEWSPHDDDEVEEAKMQEVNAREGSDKRSRHDDDHADDGEMQEVNDGEGGEERSPQDDDRAEEGDMQEVNDPGETIPTLPGMRTRKVHRPMTSWRWTVHAYFP